jgi:hypothetical protein
VAGLPGAGKSTLVRRAAADFDGIAFTCPPLPDPSIRARLGERCRSAAFDWASLFAGMLEQAREADRPWVLILDDAHHLSDARARWVAPLLAVLREARRDVVAMHVVVVGREGGLPGEDELRLGDPGGAERPGVPGRPADGEGRGGDREGDEVRTLRLGPLTLRAAAELLPGSEPYLRVRAYGVFGGIPAVLAQLDPSLTTGTNVRRLLLSPDGPLSDAPLRWLEQEVQTPTRYAAILDALAGGSTDWGGVHAGVPDLTRSGQVAPYLKRLVELGMVEVRTPLDAAPRSRARRYEAADPFLAFWFRFVLPWRLTEEAHHHPPPLRERYAGAIRPALADHMETVMPRIARGHMERDALETVGASARESGSLWGPGHDIPVAGILSSGAAFYGTCLWTAPESGTDPLARLDADIRETRYGFGRERRLRLLFSGRSTPTWLRREVARRPDAVLIDAGALVGA